MHPSVIEGIRLFNSGRFFEAHEALETLWLQVQGDEKLFLHGVIQVAAAFHHYQRQNFQGFSSLLQKGSAKLTRFSGTYYGLNIQDLLIQLQPWLDAAHGQDLAATTLPLPVIRTLGGRSTC